MPKRNFLRESKWLNHTCVIRPNLTSKHQRDTLPNPDLPNPGFVFYMYFTIMKSKYVLALSMCLLAVVSLPAQKTILHCGSVLDVKNKKVLKTVSIVVDGKRITEVKEGFIS